MTIAPLDRTPVAARDGSRDDSVRDTRWERLDRLLVRPALWVTILAGCVVLFEPSGYELAFLVLCWAVIVRGVTIPRFAAPVVILLVVLFSIGGLTSVLQVSHKMDAVIFVLVTIYLAVTTVVFAALVAEDPMGRMRIIGNAYVLGAVIAASAGVIGYFGLIPGTQDTFTLYGRARGTFKDPNVFGPFLIFPAMLLIEQMLTRGGRRLILSGAALAVIVIGLLLSFSRAAWAHFILSTLMLVAMMFVLTPDPRLRNRIGLGAVAGAVALVVLIISILSIPQVAELFAVRADLNQSYDVGETGRFARQQRALFEVIERPLGFGPLEFRHHFGEDPHNVYIKAFTAYGWVGGLSYLTFVVLTWIVAIRFAFARTPWQFYHFAAVATFLPLSLEGLIVDTDHWRHFFLIAGILWGLSAATVAWQRSQIGSPPLGRLSSGRRLRSGRSGEI